MRLVHMIIIILMLFVSACAQKPDEQLTQPQVQPALEPDVKSEEQLEAKEVETADWKTYRNEEYGFEMKYPEDWEPYGGFGEKNAYTGGSSFAVISSQEKPTEENLNEIAIMAVNIVQLDADWETEAYSWFEEGPVLKKSEKINFKGREAITGRIIIPIEPGAISDSLFIVSPDGEWLFCLILQKFDITNEEDEFTEIYKKFLDYFNFI
ncbi:hypothetical protein KY347_05430 [Candidatus Woesearchaeota archaeon]|nr:hypothetical protein [Candidatus Woesearchaeota archaeon]